MWYGVPSDAPLLGCRCMTSRLVACATAGGLRSQGRASSAAAQLLLPLTSSTCKCVGHAIRIISANSFACGVSAHVTCRMLPPSSHYPQLGSALETVKTMYSIDAVGSKANSAGPAEFQGLSSITQARKRNGVMRCRHRFKPVTCVSLYFLLQADIDDFATNDGLTKWTIDHTVRLRGAEPVDCVASRKTTYSSNYL